MLRHIGSRGARIQLIKMAVVSLFARPTPPALHRRDDFNRMLRHRTIPSVCARISDIQRHLTRRSSPWNDLAGLDMIAYLRSSPSSAPGFPPLVCRRRLASFSRANGVSDTAQKGAITPRPFDQPTILAFRACRIVDAAPTGKICGSVSVTRKASTTGLTCRQQVSTVLNVLATIPNAPILASHI
jgi:hypothetical protein